MERKILKKVLIKARGNHNNHKTCLTVGRSAAIFFICRWQIISMDKESLHLF